MKRLTPILLILIMTMSIIACSNQNAETDIVATFVPTTTSNTEPMATAPETETDIADNTDQKTITFEPTDEVVYVIHDVNIRKDPNVNAEKIGELTWGNTITRIGIGSNGWDMVMYNNTEAYISHNYLSTKEPAKTTAVTTGYPKSYSDDTCTITIYREWYENAWCYAAHLEFDDYTRFGTSCANGSYKNGNETTSDAAERLSAILCVNGCYSAPYLDYTVIRSGVLCNGQGRACWIPAVYSANTGLFQSAWFSEGAKNIAGKNVTKLVESGTVTDTFCFGPPILSPNQISKDNNGRAQRTFVGTNGNPGDIWVVVSDGRYNDGESAGLTYAQCAKYLSNKGCTFGVCLDGGGSSTIVFQGNCLNAANTTERAVVDFVYFK